MQAYDMNRGVGGDSPGGGTRQLGRILEQRVLRLNNSKFTGGVNAAVPIHSRYTY